MSCQKVVVDFTTMSDEQLLKYFTEHRSERICGNFNAVQLNKDYKARVKRPSILPLSITQKLVASFIVLQSLFHGMKLYALPKPNSEYVSYKNDTTSNKRYINGIVYDQGTERPLAGIKVVLENTDYYSVTDNNGNFSIVLDVIDTTNRYYTLSAVYDAKDSRYVSGTRILKIHGSLNAMCSTFISMYRFVGDTSVVMVLNQKIITPEQLESLPLRGYACVVSKKKPTLWQRITKPFRKNK